MLHFLIHITRNRFMMKVQTKLCKSCTKPSPV